jgi:PAS domain S-box-containing protein
MNQSAHPLHILKEVFELLPDAVVVVDQQGRMVMFNNETTKLFGYETHEMACQPVEMLINGQIKSQHASHVQSFFKKGAARRMADGAQLMARKKDGTEVRVSVALSPYKVGQDHYGLAVIREMTETISLVQKIGSLQRTKEELEHFACVVSHDLKAPVKRIHALVDMIVRELPAQNENIAVLAGYLKQNVELTEKLIEGILAQARSEWVSQQDEVALQDVFEEARSGIAVPPNFEIRLMRRLPLVNGNLIQWVQVFMNLITNAIKYNDKNDGILVIDWNRIGRFVELRFADNGTIVPREKREAIFEMFFRDGPSTGDSSHGIGLSIVKKIIEGGGGNIDYAESCFGGSEFRIKWPSTAS